jgi:ATP/maltotriose-dependent transcriptional regulator MalT/DNA-binding SARP family transcriptional activator
LSDIKYAYPLILNKVASPQYATPTLRRARLIDWLNDAANCRATVIAADAGYGKTTLLWQWEREVDFPCYWYKLDRNDRDWTFHISYLIEAISKRHEGFGRRAHSILQQMGGPGSSRPGVAAYLLAEMHERLTEPCTFIIDDWQYVNAVTEVRGLWNQILRDAPPTCRFVFASRAKPRLQFARFKTHGGYAELRTNALRFTECEIDELFRDIYNDPLEPAEVAEIERRTEGWAASLQLVEVSLRERSSPEERRQFIHSMPDTNDSDLFDFLAEEVLDQQPEETRNFLLTTSILQQITPEVAERLAGVHDGRKELNDLEHRGLFTNRLDEIRYRYHNLFREFLERRLIAERTDAEVVGLHIHAASYFETTEQWPEAIHHYLRAGLQRQAARLIAKYGEEVVAEGRLGLVDEWLQQLPDRTIRENARLSLLYGETCGIRGAWSEALEALERARTYFARKGDRRLEALACLKLSSVHSNYGDVERAAEVAEAGVDLVPEDALATRLRLEGNLAITRQWLTEPYETVVRECQRIALEATVRGFEHFAAVAHHNAGGLLLRMGRARDALASLEIAARFWSGPPTSPFADNSELVSALIAVGRLDRALQTAEEGIRRTAPWRRPNADALFGLAGAHMAEGRFDSAVSALEQASADPAILGVLHGLTHARLIEALFLAGADPVTVEHVGRELLSRAADPRYAAETAPARAITIHVSGPCRGECLAVASELDIAEAKGARATAVSGRVKLGVLALEHGGVRNARIAWSALEELHAEGPRGLKWWVRLYARHSASVPRRSGGVELICTAADSDPEGWRSALVSAVSSSQGNERRQLLDAVMKHANRETVVALKDVEGRDVAEARRHLHHAQAARLFLRTFGGVRLHRGSWSGPQLKIEKRRVRTLLAVLAAHVSSTLTRDSAIDILWPDADADSAVNSLNQTVYQLRRYIDPGYRGGESPEYIISTSDHVGLNLELVHTDLEEIRRLPARLANGDWAQRQIAARRAAGLVTGEFLADLRYENWTSTQQIAIHNEVRERLLPIALAPVSGYEIDIATQAASALISLDPFDEQATLALAECLTRSGRRVAARDLVVDFAHRMQTELDEAPSPQFGLAAAALSAGPKRQHVAISQQDLGP